MFWIFRRNVFAHNSFLNAKNNNSCDNRPAKRNYDRLEDHCKSYNVSEDECLDNETSYNNNAKQSEIDRNNAEYIDNYKDDGKSDFSLDSEDDEALTCNVCDRSFACSKQLSSHQHKKRHFGCSACDSLFPTLMALEHHKEEFEHWSEEDDDEEGDFCLEESDDEMLTEEKESLL